MRLRCHTLICTMFLFGSVLIADSLNGQSRTTIFDPLSVRASSRIASEIDDGSLRLLPGNHHFLARPEFDAGAVTPDLPMQRMVLVLQPSQAQAAALDALLQAQRNPASPYFHLWLTPEQIADYFGASSVDTQRIVGWLENHAMRIDEVAASRRTITFSGTASQVERAFATRMRRYKINGALQIANAINPSIPSALAPVVMGVLSLHDFPLHAMRSSIGKPVSQINYGSTHYVTPADLATIYNVNPLYAQGVDGKGQSVAVVARSNINLSDVHTFRQNYGLPVNDPQVIVNGKDPGTSNSGELIEATLDAEYAGALAKNATVKFVTSASTSASDGTYLSAQYIVNQNFASVMTMSFGLCEKDMGTAENAFINGLWQQAAAQGITVLVSAGDSGAAGCDGASSSQSQFGLGVNGLCSTPYDLCVGGTQFDDAANPSQYWSANSDPSTNGSALSYIPEVVWNESTLELWAGGGGSSSIYGKPEWQTGKGVPSDGMRDVPDVSLAAAGHDGYMVLVNGLPYVVGGTSAASPALASILALVAQSAGTRLGAANANLYALANQQSSAAAFHDVTTGNNSVPGLGGYSATAGYDLASGLGSVDANALVTHWRDGQATPSIQLTLGTSSLVLSPSASSPITVNVAGSGGFNSTVTLTTFGLPKGVTATFLPASIAAPGSGLLQLAIASTVAAGSYTFNIVAASGSLSSSATANITVVVPAASPTYTLTPSSNAVSIAAGSMATVKLNLASANYAGTVMMTASSSSPAVPAMAPSVTLKNNGTGSSTLTISTSTNAANHAPVRPGKNGGALVLCAVLLGTPFTLLRRRALAVLLAATAISLAGLLMACGGGSGGSATNPAPRTYTVTITPEGSGEVTNPSVVTITVTVL
jgi:pseudomonalisin